MASAGILLRIAACTHAAPRLDNFSPLLGASANHFDAIDCEVGRHLGTQIQPDSAFCRGIDAAHRASLVGAPPLTESEFHLAYLPSLVSDDSSMQTGEGSPAVSGRWIGRRRSCISWLWRIPS